MTTSDEPIIEVKHLSKRYRIGLDQAYKTFCETAVTTLKSPVQALRKLRQRTDTFWALQDITFEVQRGEVVGPQRRGQDDAPEDPGADHASGGGRGRAQRPCRQLTGGGHGVPSGAHPCLHVLCAMSFDGLRNHQEL